MIKREIYLKQIRPFINKDIIKVITGLRRSGKSCVLEQLRDEIIDSGVKSNHILYLNFESLKWSHLTDSASLYDYINAFVQNKKGKIYFFFDELQEVTNFERVINSLRVDFNCDIYITGSNAELLSSELATYLAGRYISFVIYPFGYKEVLQITGQEASDASLNDFLIQGGMPAIYDLRLDGESAQKYFEDLYNSVILKDIVKRYKIRDVDMLERIIHYALDNIGRVFSSNSIVKYMKSERRKVSLETVMSYLNAANASHLIRQTKRNDVIGKKILKVDEKYYVADHGLRNAILGVEDLFSVIEQIIENVVGMELLRRGYKISVGKVGTKAIDFIAEKRGKRAYYQVSYLLTSPETIDRAFGIYETIHDNYPKYVISMDKLNFSKNGIVHLSLLDFLTS
ncbi:ATPase [Lactococcus hodotermopsidis]|uniref:ATPase n=1 Tax=Pseudolactococcus hodotermopsidis TaxID=2709157 RepID=A0A6A0BDR3_9LACT|nr:ATP-binding protein [Lactococcus hodotermopsidis]GFH42833.1 ATPase [Lactococcus hodotermopsidis]